MTVRNSITFSNLLQIDQQYCPIQKFQLAKCCRNNTNNFLSISAADTLLLQSAFPARNKHLLVPPPLLKLRINQPNPIISSPRNRLMQNRILLSNRILSCHAKQYPLIPKESSRTKRYPLMQNSILSYPSESSHTKRYPLMQNSILPSYLTVSSIWQHWFRDQWS